MMMFHVPEDPGLLAAFGEVALRHEHLSHILRMTIKTFAGIEVNEALDATAFEGASLLRERVRKLAKQRLGEGQATRKSKRLWSAVVVRQRNGMNTSTVSGHKNSTARPRAATAATVGSQSRPLRNCTRLTRNS